MNRWRVGEDIGSKETDRYPLTSMEGWLLMMKIRMYGPGIMGKSGVTSFQSKR
jgi:hypothetical protein